MTVKEDVERELEQLMEDVELGRLDDEDLLTVEERAQQLQKRIDEFDAAEQIQRGLGWHA